MIFNFTFSFGVPGISNPFVRATSTPPPPSRSSSTPTVPQALQPSRSRSPLLTPQQSGRKRGWEPTFAEPTAATTPTTTTSIKASSMLPAPRRRRARAAAESWPDTHEPIGVWRSILLFAPFLRPPSWSTRGGCPPGHLD